MKQEGRITSLKEFYPYYLSEHKDVTCRVLHFIGTLLFFSCLATSLILKQYQLLWLCPLLGYGFAWVGHFFFEKNKPATFKYPLYSLTSDFMLFFELLLGKQKFNPNA
ncbi:MAG: DUF962 domain-containing protein [Bacteroidetes bacterium]|nr:MAG: DUF962 domain-containing protein [Bacteroidota bacterium]